jgi:hypothetical protein
MNFSSAEQKLKAIGRYDFSARAERHLQRMKAKNRFPDAPPGYENVPEAKASGGRIGGSNWGA